MVEPTVAAGMPGTYKSQSTTRHAPVTGWPGRWPGPGCGVRVSRPSRRAATGRDLTFGSAVDPSARLVDPVLQPTPGVSRRATRPSAPAVPSPDTRWHETTRSSDPRDRRGDVG